MSDSILSDVWTLSSGGVTVAAAQAGVTEIVRRRAVQSVETCRLVAAGRAFDAPPLFPFGSSVVVKRAGAPWFVGRVTSTPGTGDGSGEVAEIVLSGPWWYLENLVYQQLWTLRGGEASGWLGRVIVGQDADGSRLSSGDIVAAALQFAIDAGAPFQVGTIEPDAVPPLDELRDVTCAEVVRKTLRWQPDGVAWFDHTTLPTPTFHCRKRANLPAVTLTIGQPPLAAVRGITARLDLLVPAVVVCYETEDGDGGTDVVVDAAPEGATGREFGALVATIPAGAPEPGATHVTLGDLPTAGSGGSGDLTLAQSLYAARSVPVYSGSVVLVEPEAGASGTVGVGTVLNIAGAGRSEWATMRGVVVEDETRVASGTTTVRFGPAEHLDAGGLAAALSVTRAGVGGREPGSPGAVRTPGSATRVSGR